MKIIKYLILTSIILTMLLGGCWTTPEPPNEVAYRALLVGVGTGNLQSPSYNVDRMKEILDKCKFGKKEVEFLFVDELKNKDATKEAILNGIGSAFSESDENDISYFYFMGHGGVKDGIPVLIPSDYFTSQTLITVHELESALSSTPSTKVVFLETCHSGNFIGKNKNDFNDIVINIFKVNKDLLTSNQYQVLTACKGSQLCWSSECGEPFGYFNMAFYKGAENLLADADENGIISLLEMRDYIKLWIQLHCMHKQQVQMYPENSTFPIVEYSSISDCSDGICLPPEGY